jgi:hypothetical protein
MTDKSMNKTVVYTDVLGLGKVVEVLLLPVMLGGLFAFVTCPIWLLVWWLS